MIDFGDFIQICRCHVYVTYDYGVVCFILVYLVCLVGVGRRLCPGNPVHAVLQKDYFTRGRRWHRARFWHHRTVDIAIQS